jgi:hypothetical protein
MAAVPEVKCEQQTAEQLARERSERLDGIQESSVATEEARFMASLARIAEGQLILCEDALRLLVGRQGEDAGTQAVQDAVQMLQRLVTKTEDLFTQLQSATLYGWRPG